MRTKNQAGYIIFLIILFVGFFNLCRGELAKESDNSLINSYIEIIFEAAENHEYDIDTSQYRMKLMDFDPQILIMRLSKYLDEDDSFVRMEIAEFLYQLAKKTPDIRIRKEVVKRLEKIKDDPFQHAKVWYLLTVSLVERENSIEKIEPYLNDSSPHIQYIASRIIAQFVDPKYQPFDKYAVEVLQKYYSLDYKTKEEWRAWIDQNLDKFNIIHSKTPDEQKMLDDNENIKKEWDKEFSKKLNEYTSKKSPDPGEFNLLQSDEVEDSLEKLILKIKDKKIDQDNLDVIATHLNNFPLRDVVEQFQHLFHDDDQIVRLLSLSVFLAWAKDQVIADGSVITEALNAFKEDPSAINRAVYVMAVFAIKGENSKKDLIHLLDDQTQMVWSGAAYYLALLEDYRGIPLLIESIGKEQKDPLSDFSLENIDWVTNFYPKDSSLQLLKQVTGKDCKSKEEWEVWWEKEGKKLKKE